MNTFTNFNDIDSVIDSLDDFTNQSEKSRKKFLYSLLMDDSFMQAMFRPTKEATTNESVDKFYQLYAKLTKNKVLKTLCEITYEYCYDEFNRTQATLLYSIANIALNNSNEEIANYEKRARDGEITKSELKAYTTKFEKKTKTVATLMKVIRKIVKADAKKLSKMTGLPKYVCTLALHTVPDTKYVDRFKISFYLSTLLSDIYAAVDQGGRFVDTNKINWRAFFSVIFGKQNVIEVATFILLEGVYRIDMYKKSDSVHRCWNSLTQFALKELEHTPETLRSQMIELYIKRIDKMFANKTFDLRVDMTKLQKSDFPNLVKTMSRYSSKIIDILKRNK